MRFKANNQWFNQCIEVVTGCLRSNSDAKFIFGEPVEISMLINYSSIITVAIPFQSNAMLIKHSP